MLFGLGEFGMSLYKLVLSVQEKGLLVVGFVAMDYEALLFNEGYLVFGIVLYMVALGFSFVLYMLVLGGFVAMGFEAMMVKLGYPLSDS